MKIQPSVGNFLVIGLTASVFIVGGIAAMHALSRGNVPLLSPTARAGVDFTRSLTGVKAA